MTLKTVAGAACAKSNHRAAGNASHATKGPKSGSTASNAKRDGSEDQHLTPKFLEAIKNPNWRERQRSSSSGTFEIVNAESAQVDKVKAWAGEGASPPSVDGAQVEPDNVNNRKISVSDRQFNVRQQSNSLSSTSCDDCGSHSDSASWSKTFVNILRHESLSCSSDGSGPYLVEIVPYVASRETSLQGSSDGPEPVPRLATLNRLTAGPAKSPGQESKSTERYRPTPMYVPKHTREATVNNRKSAQKAATGAKQGTDKQPSMPEVTAAGRESSCAAKASLDAKNAAFRKMLERLKKGPRAGQSELRDSGYGTKSGSEATVEEGSGGAHERSSPLNVPTMTRALRGLTLSDSAAANYRSKQCQSSRADGSEDSGYAEISSNKGHELNPKAREFLSFEPGKAGDHLFGTGGAKHNGDTATAFPVPESKPATLVSSSKPLVYGWVPAPLGLESAGALGQQQFPPWLGSAGNATAWPPRVDSVYPSELDGLVKGPQQSLGWLSGGAGLAQPMGLVPAPQTGGYGVRSLPARLHCPAPSPQMPLLPLTGPMARPPAVPKPKMPNAGDQQAYEAYIEQRKALEPGYALECRLRQQRRAKRTVNPQSAQAMAVASNGAPSQPEAASVDAIA